MITVIDDIVVKRHSAQTDPALLARQLSFAFHATDGTLLAPLSPTPALAPDGRTVSLWPRVEVFSPEDASFPWAEAGDLLARLHGHRAPGLQSHGGRARLARTIQAARALSDPASAELLADLALRLLRTWPNERRAALVHGDFHLGQLGRTSSGDLVLLDIDDLGVGEPAWDLGRPAGFHAAGLLESGDWEAFVDAYRARAPWPDGVEGGVLDHAARSAVVIATVRELRAGATAELHSADTADALLQACHRLAQ